MRIHNTIDKMDNQIFTNGEVNLTVSELKNKMKDSFRYGCGLQPDQAEKELMKIINLYLDHKGMEHTDENQDKVWEDVVMEHLDNYTKFLSEVDYRSAPLAHAALETCKFFELIGYGK